MIGLLLLAGVLGGCSEGDDDEEHHARGRCVLFREREPNDTALTAQFLDPGFTGDCVIVEGKLLAATDVDSYRILVEETLTLVVTVDHSQEVDFDLLLFRVKDLQVPKLLVCGERETRFMPNRAFAEPTVPGLRVVGANAGHAVNIEAAETFNTAVVDFLRRHLNTSGRI